MNSIQCTYLFLCTKRKNFFLLSIITLMKQFPLKMLKKRDSRVVVSLMDILWTNLIAQWLDTSSRGNQPQEGLKQVHVFCWPIFLQDSLSPVIHSFHGEVRTTKFLFHDSQSLIAKSKSVPQSSSSGSNRFRIGYLGVAFATPPMTRPEKNFSIIFGWVTGQRKL